MPGCGQLSVRGRQHRLPSARRRQRIGDPGLIEGIVAIDLGDPAAYGKAIQAAWDKAAPRARAMREHEGQLAGEGKLLELYRAINLPASQQLAISVDFRAALSEGSQEHYGYRYVSGWEIRNMRMVSNVHASFADQPGARVLAVVGAMHKPWFDNWLGQLQGVDIVDAAQVLGDDGQ